MVQVRDLGSRNGTFLNGASIGRRTQPNKPKRVAGRAFPYFRAHDGDEIRIGDTVLRITASVWREETEHVPDESAVLEPGGGL
jgi:pSer/pThr/pTyr-binding forkhead associated (FHA) protein